MNEDERAKTQLSHLANVELNIRFVGINCLCLSQTCVEGSQQFTTTGLIPNHRTRLTRKRKKEKEKKRKRKKVFCQILTYQTSSLRPP